MFGASLPGCMGWMLIVCIGCGSPQPPALRSGPRLTVLDRAETVAVAGDRQREVAFKIMNTGDDDLRIGPIDTSCG